MRRLLLLIAVLVLVAAGVATWAWLVFVVTPQGEAAGEVVRGAGVPVSVWVGPHWTPN